MISLKKMSFEDIKTVIVFSLPLMIVFLAQKGIHLIDTLMMGCIGPHALAAGALGMSIFSMLLVFCMGILSSVGIFINRARGENDEEKVKSSLQNGIRLAILLSIPSVIILSLMPSVLSIMGKDIELVKNTKHLLNGLAFGFPGMLLFLVFREFFASFSLSRIVMIITLISLPMTFFTNYILIYGKFGFPELQVAGIGIAGAVIMWFMFISVWIYAVKHSTLKSFLATFQLLKVDFNKIKKMLSLGVSSGIILVLDSGMFVAAALMISSFSVDSLAAHQIALQCASIAYAIPFSLAMVTALQVSHALGAENYIKVRHFTTIGLILGLVLSSLVSLVFILFPEFIIKLFLLGSDEISYEGINELGVTFLAIASFFQCFDALQAIANGALRGLKDTHVSMLISIGCYWILGIGSAYYFAFYTSLGAKGVWYGLIIGICGAGIFLGFRLIQQLKLFGTLKVKDFFHRNDIIIQ